MKKYFTLFAFIILSLISAQCLNAQRADKNKLRATFTQYPYQPLPDSVKTYSSEINTGGISFKYIHLNKPLAYVETGTSNNYGSVEKADADFLILPGYNKLSSGGDLNILVDFKKIEVSNKLMKTAMGRFIETNQTVDRLMYYYEFSFNYFAAAYITNSANDTIYQKVYKDLKGARARFGSCGECKEASSGPHQSFGASYTSQDELEDRFQKNFLVEHQNTLTRDALMEIKNYLFNFLGKPMVYRDFDFISGKGGKFDYSDLDTAVSIMRSAFDMIGKERGDISLATPFILESIGIWEKALDQSNVTDKKARINEEITAGLQHNIALAYAWLRDFNKSREWAAKAVKSKDGQKLMQNVQGWIDDHEKRLAANGLI